MMHLTVEYRFLGDSSYLQLTTDDDATSRLLPPYTRWLCWLCWLF